jgi:lysophospholipase L1-like esterase
MRMRVTRALVGLSVVIGIVVAAQPASLAGPRAAAAGNAAPFYLALGDSVAAGFQPNRGITNQGYVDDLWRSVRASRIPDLRLRNVACPGETSHSLISGNGSPCYAAGASQLDTALDFIRRHPGDVAFVTIDIGGNDLLYRCVNGETLRFDRACVIDLMPRVGARVEHIVRNLRAALGRNVPIVGMNYYNPFLGLWALLPGGHRLARAAQRSWVVFNHGLETAFRRVHAPVADVATAFRIDDFADRVATDEFGIVPLNVALACQWTWFCSSRFTGDPHPNRTGHSKIARAFRRTLGTVWANARR